MTDDKEDILLETGTNELEIAEFEIYSKPQTVSKSDDGDAGVNSDEKDIHSYGINVAKIREIITMPTMIKMPGSDEKIVGVFNLREKIIPLIDLSAWMNYNSDVDYSKCNVVVTEFNQSNFGFIINSVNRIHRVSWTKILSSSNINKDSNSSSANCITGIVNFEDRIMMMLDFERIVADINPEMSLSVLSDKDTLEEFNSKDFSGKKVLVAEDSDIVRDLFVDILEKAGFEVIEASNGKIASEYIDAVLESATQSGKSIKDFLQVVITDIEMPQMDGHSLCKKIKESDDLNSLPVILFSSLIYEEMRKKGELIGADAQISKPDIGNLVNIISDILKKQD